jgi:hypothetical protein
LTVSKQGINKQLGCSHRVDQMLWLIQEVPYVSAYNFLS